MKNKCLIVNADDFGICTATNKAIKELFQNNKITSTSLLANAMATDEAIKIAKEQDMSVGVHLTLNSDFENHPWKAVAGVSTLSDSRGFLFANTKMAAKAKSKDVTNECLAQIDLISSEVKVDHLDNHSGTMYGINKRLFFINAFKLAKKYKLPFRFPQRNNFLNDYFSGGAPALIKAAHGGIVLLAKIMRVKLIDNMITNPYGIKDIQSYKQLEEFYVNALINLQEGVNEMFLHPSYHSDILAQQTKEWKKREYELEFLQSQKFEKTIKDEGIELINYNYIKK